MILQKRVILLRVQTIKSQNESLLDGGNVRVVLIRLVKYETLMTWVLLMGDESADDDPDSWAGATRPKRDVVGQSVCPDCGRTNVMRRSLSHARRRVSQDRERTLLGLEKARRMGKRLGRDPERAQHRIQVT